MVLIDADLRRSRIHKAFGLENKTGITNLFVQPNLYLDGASQPAKTENLRIMTSGGTPPNPSELLGSKKMSEILKGLEETTDIILLDTPPVLTVTDAVALSSSVDGVIVVAKIGNTKQAALVKAIEQLRQVNANIMGVVINDINLRSSRYYYYYRNYYYDHYTEYYSNAPDGKNNGGRKTSSKQRSSGKSETPVIPITGSRR